jgi:hypothetical protein
VTVVKLAVCESLALRSYLVQEFSAVWRLMADVAATNSKAVEDVGILLMVRAHGCPPGPRPSAVGLPAGSGIGLSGLRLLYIQFSYSFAWLQKFNTAEYGHADLNYDHLSNGMLPASYLNMHTVCFRELHIGTGPYQMQVRTVGRTLRSAHATIARTRSDLLLWLCSLCRGRRTLRGTRT